MSLEQTSRDLISLSTQTIKRIFVTGVLISGLHSAQSLAQNNALTESLTSIYERSKSHDLTIKAAEFDYQAAIERLPLARSAFLPQLNAAFDANRQEANDDTFGTWDTTRLSLSLRQSLFHRENSAIVSQARLGVKQAEAQLLAQRQNLILRVANAYFDVLRAQIEVEFSQSELQAIARQKDQAEKRFEVGLVPVTDVRTAQAQADLAVAAEIAASNQLENALEALFVISGVRPELLAALADDLPLIAPDPADAESWVELALDQNLDLVAARLAAETASAGVRSARGSRYPTIDFVGTAQTTDTEEPGRESDSGLLGFEVRLPLYTGGRISSQVRQAKSEAASAFASLESLERTTAQQARDAYRGVTVSIARASALRQALVSTRKSSEATDAGFRAGTRTSVEVLGALRDVFRAESDFAGARFDYILNYLSLKAAAGTLSDADLVPINNFLVALGAE